MAAWFVSHCETESEREKYVRELQKHIDVRGEPVGKYQMTYLIKIPPIDIPLCYDKVDIYGECSQSGCSKHSNPPCEPTVEWEYKFYLSFENSLCSDYVTEKFFIYMNKDIVPIVLGN